MEPPLNTEEEKESDKGKVGCVTLIFALCVAAHYGGEWGWLLFFWLLFL